MALRVLLADESATIKKVMQISLQDYAVEVRSVQLGVDVLQVAQQFKPDIIFVDILLQKKNGYEVSQELKRDPQTRAIPVILMWSGFMEVDVSKLKASLADNQLEKPFDADGLRSLVNKFVPKTQSQGLAQHLEFPNVPKIEVTQKTQTKTQFQGDMSLELEARMPLPEKTSKPAAKAAAPEPEAEGSGWSMDSFDDLGKFGQSSQDQDDNSYKKVSLGRVDEETTKPGTKMPVEEEGGLDLTAFSEDDYTNDNWVQKDLSSFKVDLPEGDEEPIALDFDVPDDELENLINTQTKPMVRKDSLAHAKADSKPAAKTYSREPAMSVAAPTTEQIEKIIREQSQEIIEKVVKKLVPDLASQLIKDEIRRLLDESP